MVFGGNACDLETIREKKDSIAHKRQSDSIRFDALAAPVYLTRLSGGGQFKNVESLFTYLLWHGAAGNICLGKTCYLELI